MTVVVVLKALRLHQTTWLWCGDKKKSPAVVFNLHKIGISNLRINKSESCHVCPHLC